MKKNLASGSREVTIEVSGSGKTKEEAFAKAMSMVQKKLSQQEQGILIRIEPLEVDLVEGREVTGTERFLFFFFKREISTFTVKLNVKVNLYTVDIESVEFEKTKETGRLKWLRV